MSGVAAEARRPSDLRAAERVFVALRTMPAAAWLVGIVLASTLLRARFALGVPAPWIIPDELIYSELAKGIAAGEGLTVRGDAFPGLTYGPLYALSIAPAYALFADPEQAYGFAKLTGSLVMSLAAVPAYLLARRVAGRALALLAAVLAVSVPSMAYSATLMTETMSYPAFLFAMLALVRAVERPSMRGQALALGAIAVATGTRLQWAILLPAFVAAIALVGLAGGADGHGRLRRIRTAFARFRLTLAVTVLGLPVAVVLAAARGRSPLELIGSYRAALPKLELGDLPRWFVYHAAELDLYVGIVPFAAFLLVAASTLRTRAVSPALRAFVATSISVGVLLVALVAAFATQDDVARIQERYVFYLAPLLLIGLLALVESGLPRPRWSAVAVLGLAVLLPAALPFDELVNRHAYSSTLGLLPLGGVGTVVDPYAHTTLLVLLAGAVAAGLFLLVPSRLGALLPLGVLCMLLVTAPIVQARHVQVAETAHAEGLGDEEPRWVDLAVGPREKVPIIWTGTASRTRHGWYAVWQTEFFNRSIGAVYRLREPMRYRLPERVAAPDARGVLRTADGQVVSTRYVLSDTSFQVVGREVARNRDTGLVLYEVGGPVRQPIE